MRRYVDDINKNNYENRSDGWLMACGEFVQVIRTCFFHSKFNFSFYKLRAFQLFYIWIYIVPAANYSIT